MKFLSSISAAHARASRKGSRAFTIMELLIVIAIIGILTAVILSVTTSARIKGRDAHRVSEIRQIRYALEQYRLVNGQYPRCLTAHGSCLSGNALAGTAFMKTVPVDPLTRAPYAYAAIAAVAGGTPCTSYHLGTTLEDRSNASLRTGADAVPTANICLNSDNDFSGLAYQSNSSFQCTGVAGIAQPTSVSNGESCYDVIPD